jgi:hypothetical protein
MKKHILHIFILLLLASCDNEIDINAPWVETPVVFGLLDADTNVQYIRIQKTYLNSVDQTTDQGAQYPDSLYFDTLVVKVFSSTGQEFNFVKTTYPKDDGFFTNENHVVYRASGFQPNINTTYRLNIFSPKSGKTYLSNTSVIARTTFSTSPVSIRYRPDLNSNLVFRATPGANSVVIDAVVRLKYLEYPVGNPSAAVTKFVDYFSDQSLVLSSTGDYQRFNNMRSMFDIMASKLAVNNAVERRFLSIDYVFYAGTTDLKLVIDLSKPSQSLVQVNPEFSNIEGGLGIFTGRTESNRYGIPLADDSTRIYISMELPNFVY